MSVVFTEQKFLQSRHATYIQIQCSAQCVLYLVVFRSLIHNKCNNWTPLLGNSAFLLVTQIPKPGKFRKLLISSWMLRMDFECRLYLKWFVMLFQTCFFSSNSVIILPFYIITNINNPGTRHNHPICTSFQGLYYNQVLTFNTAHII